MAPPLAVKVKPYRHFLTSILHRGFVKAMLYALVVCYIDALLIGTKSTIWDWTPFSMTLIRWLLLSISTLPIFILRVAAMHIGARTTVSSFCSVRQFAARLSTIQTFLWYSFSAWWFNEVYVWSAQAKIDIWWIAKEDMSRQHGKRHLNEKTVYLLSFYIAIGALQSFVHLYNDYDQVRLPLSARNSGSLGPRPKSSTTKIRDALPVVFLRSVLISTTMACINPFIYASLTRNWFWYPSVNFVGLANNVSATSWHAPSNTGVTIGLSQLFRCAGSGTLLVLLWEASNLCFSIYLAQSPVKKGLPLSNESKDPNGTLLQGLNAQKEVPRTFAFWELSQISENFAERRKLIFNDIDREGGPAWTQILQASLNVIRTVQNRIKEFESPSSPPMSNSSSPSPTIKTLPSITTGPETDNILLVSPSSATRSERLEARIGPLAKSFGQSAPWTPSAKAKAAAITQSLIEWAPEHIFSPKQHIQRVLPPASAPSASTSSISIKASPNESCFTVFFRAPISEPLRQTVPRRIRSVALGDPTSTLHPILSAANGITHLLIASLTEDLLGKVSLDFLLVIKTLTETIAVLETFVAKMQGANDVNGDARFNRHWTDIPGAWSLSDLCPPSVMFGVKLVFGGAPDSALTVTSPPTNATKVSIGSEMQEVNILRTSLKACLEDLLNAFEPYLGQLDLKGRDLRLAKEAAGLGNEISGDGVGGSNGGTA